MTGDDTDIDDTEKETGSDPTFIEIKGHEVVKEPTTGGWRDR